jgi:DNA repair exonuclease SbcCD ATPase subunit
MADVDNGALSFSALLDNSQLDAATEETLRRVMGLTDATVLGGEKMERAFNATAESIRSALKQIGVACAEHEEKIESLEAEYKRLGSEASAAFMQGREDEVRRIKEQQAAIQGEITVRKACLNELREYSDILEDAATKQEEHRQKIDDNAKAADSMRARIKELKEEMMSLVDQGIDEQSAHYQALKDELGRLQDIQSDVMQQGRILANDEAQYQGIISGLSGVAGGLSAATGAMSLFAGENEDLQKVMTKVQSVMAITIGLQQVSEALNKDSAFTLVTLRSAKEWWANAVAKAAAAENIENAAIANNTAATALNTASKGANAGASGAASTAHTANAGAIATETVAAKAGTFANLSLAGAFRAVGIAIKTIPVFGWVIAGISALIAVVSHFVSKANEAKKAAKEFGDAVAENAYKPIGTIMQLSNEWDKLGDNLAAKEKFIDENRQKFDELGVAVRNTRDAENLLVANKDAFIAAQIAKAKALAIITQMQEKVKKALELQNEIETMPDKVTRYNTTGGMGGFYNTSYEVENSSKKEKKAELDALNAEIKKGYKTAYNYEKDGAKALKDAGIGGMKEYAAGTVGAIEQAIAKKNEALKNLKPNTKAYKNTVKEIADLRKQIDTSSSSKSGGSSSKSSVSDKDPFVEQLKARKAEYQRFLNWVNSGDKILVNAAKTEFQGLIAEGKTYIDYLKNQRDQLLAIGDNERTKQENAQLRALNDAIAEETKRTVLESFNEELSSSLTNAQTVIEMLGIIEQKRKELENDESGLSEQKRESLDEAERDVIAKQQEQTNALLNDYASYLDRKIKMEMQYNNDMKLLETAREKATTDAERKKIETAIANRKNKFVQDSKSSGDADYDEMLKQFRTYEQKKEAIHEDFEEKRRVARLHGNEELLAELNTQEAKAQLQNSFDQLKASPEYISAFEDLKNVSDETLKYLLSRFEEVKMSAAENLNPEDLREFANTMKQIADELNTRNPFESLKKGYKELKIAARELKAAERELANIRKNGGAGTAEETAAIKKYNKAKDEYIKKNNQVRKSEKEVTGAISDLSNALSDVGKSIGGQAGEIISLIGDIASFTMNAIENFKTASEASSKAVETMEKASVILSVISAAFQIATKIMSLFGDGGRADYEKAEKMYKAYIDVLDEVINKQQELMASMSGENAINSYKYALSLIKEQEEAARELGQQYLRTGATFFSHSNGIQQRNDMSLKAWQQFKEAASIVGFDAWEVGKGRMTGLFSLTVEQLQYLKEHAPIFWANLHEETRNYLQQIIDCQAQVEILGEKFEESLTGVSMDALNDDFLSMLQEWDMSAKGVAENMAEYMRKALIQQMYKAQYKSELERWYKMWADAMNPEGEGGTSITENEQRALDTLRNSIVNGATAAAQRINEQFQEYHPEEKDDTTLTGGVQSVSEETASVVAGQTNAIRINQVEATGVLRQQLIALNQITQYVRYCTHLARIERIVYLLEQRFGDSERSQGL